MNSHPPGLSHLEGTSPGPTSVSTLSARPQRVLACILCQQRKVKCDRKFPCANCIKSRVQCVPGSLGQRRRKRRFPERELLDRLRKYEDPLRQHNIPFEPLHKDLVRSKESPRADGNDDSEEDQVDHVNPDVSTPSTATRSDKDYKAKSYWHAVSKGLRDHDFESDSSNDDVREKAVKKAWDQAIDHDDHLLFCSRRSTIELATLHPNPVQIFRLWQIYLDNVNPLLKVTHTPSLQVRIIEAASNIASIDPVLEALMFSIYCTAVLSLSLEECQTVFSSSKDDLLTRYRFGCQEALSNAGFLRSSNLDCVTAFFLYLTSVRISTLPPSLSVMLGAAVRIAQRIGIHNESVLSKCTIVEAELSRRLWWSLVLFDARMTEVASGKSAVLDPTWDSRMPLNVNDSDLRPEMKNLPVAQTKPTEAVFAVVRSEIGEFARHAEFHLDFNAPALKPIALHRRSSLAVEFSDLTKLEERIENQYLRFCDEENPIHFMTIWTARGTLAKFRLMEYLATSSNSPAARTDAQHDLPTSYAIKMLECDTRILTSPLVRKFIWLYQMYFPFAAYLQLFQDLKKRPTNDQASRTWDVMSDNFDSWFDLRFRDDSPFFQLFTKIALQAWEVCEAAYLQVGEIPTPPRMVSSIKEIVARTAQETETLLANLSMDIGANDFSMPLQPELAGGNTPYDAMMQGPYTMGGPSMWPGTTGQLPFNFAMNQQNWNALTGKPLWGGF